VYLKKDLIKKGLITSEDVDDDEYDYEYVIEEEHEYEHF
jgi:hypothetical protein